MEIFIYPMFISISFLPFIWHLQIMFDNLKLLLHFFEHMRPNKDPSYWVTLVDMSITTPRLILKDFW